MSRLKDALRADKPVLGILAGTANSHIIELCGWLGYDFVLIDMEHGAGLDISTVLPLIVAADASGVEVIVRVPNFDEGMIQNLLDCGAEGICVPHVQTREDAERAVRACKYPPDGRRAAAPIVRDPKFLGSSLADFGRLANAGTVVMVIVEEKEGIDNLDEIAAVPGLDILWIGPGDLSLSLGVEMGSPELADAQLRGLEAAKRNGLAAYAGLGSPLVDREKRQTRFRQDVEKGYRVFAAVDTSVFRASLKEIVDAVRAV